MINDKTYYLDLFKVSDRLLDELTGKVSAPAAISATFISRARPAAICFFATDRSLPAASMSITALE